MKITVRIKTEEIVAYLEKEQIEKTAFCKLCKINMKTLNKILNSDINFRFNSLLKVGKFLNIPVCELFDK